MTRNAKSKKIIGMIMLANLTVLLAASIPSMAGEKTKEVPDFKAKNIYRRTGQVSGTVTAVNKNGIAVAYKRDLAKGTEEEVYATLNKDTKFVHKQRIEGINVGDTVTLQFEEVNDEADMANPKNEREAKTITFVSPAQAHDEN